MASAHAIHDMALRHTLETLIFTITNIIIENISHIPTTKENATQNPSLNKKHSSIDYIPKLLSLRSSLNSHPMVVAALQEMVLPLCTL